MYSEAENEIREAVIAISNKYELGKKDTVSILTYLVHDIMSIREEDRAGKSDAQSKPNPVVNHDSPAARKICYLKTSCIRWAPECFCSEYMRS
jgi:hypothetical protein